MDAGDIVRHVHGSDAYLVAVNYGRDVIAGRTVLLSHHREWILVSKAERPGANSTARNVEMAEAERRQRDLISKGPR